MIKYNDPLDEMKMSQVRDISEMSLAWCMMSFGINKRRRKDVSIVVDFTHEDGDAYGAYCSSDNKIYIYLKLVNNVKDLVKTIIHEYIHSLQPLPSQYDKLMRQHKFYSRHPFERQAVYYENKYGRTLWNTISPLL